MNALRSFNIFPALCLAALAAGSCVYSFTPDIKGDDIGIVIEGDILIGDVSAFTISEVSPFSGDVESELYHAESVTVEDSGGHQYPGTRQNSDYRTFDVDLTEAPDDLSYRLVVKAYKTVYDSDLRGGSGRMYYTFTSSWKEVLPAPEIDSLTYTVDDSNLYLRLSMNAAEGDGCYRWDYEQTWKWHAQLYAQYVYDVERDTLINLMSGMTGQEPPHYWCWSSSNSTQAGIAIAKATVGEKLVDHQFLSIPRTDRMIQTKYSILLRARSISEECYEYLHAMELNSTSSGSLTMPDPDRIDGNITCAEDPSEFATGYVEVSKLASKRVYIGAGYYRFRYTGGELFLPDTEDMTLSQYYYMGYRPVEYRNDPEQGSGVFWAPQRCVECTADGGSEEKPSFWED